MKRLLEATTLAAFVAWSLPVHAALFSENFNDGNASTRWSVVSQQESGGSAPPDGSVDFAFDYSSIGIANPSGGSDTIGAFIQVNKTDQPGAEGESYSIFPNGKSFSGKFFVEADMFVYNDGGGGSTEFGMAGLFLDNSSPVSPYEFGSVGGPYALTYSGEGGATRDLAVFEEGSGSSTGYIGLGDYAAFPAGTIPGFQTGVGGALGPAGSNPRGSWVKIRVASDGTTINSFLNGALIDSYDNSGGFYTAGNILLGAADPFNSSNGNNGTVIDNVTVGVPEPASFALLGLSLIGLVASGRKRS
ncbi:PEP-CTERM sorting domain-containing protein [Bythopirellula polymerisocia]|uniref:PEP-CTERM motif protein n=1 Tax=Bythopirellula polymerisocia TaxID=2528003 RepID=A0A5C6CH61_9BACT|nr:PEP-CTERM sorting domain-containing protein [Bythopirellula polymerisocia]TWU22566.1 PEP-CTERM motif protein [Bythopirellula polymerisocia]